MVSSDTIKSFQVKDFDTDTIFTIEMTILDYMKFRQMEQLIQAVKHG